MGSAEGTRSTWWCRGGGLVVEPGGPARPANGRAHRGARGWGPRSNQQRNDGAAPAPVAVAVPVRAPFQRPGGWWSREGRSFAAGGWAWTRCTAVASQVTTTACTRRGGAVPVRSLSVPPRSVAAGGSLPPTCGPQRLWVPPGSAKPARALRDCQPVASVT